MTTTILAILAAAIPLILWLVRRKITHEDDPATKHTEKREAIANYRKAILTGLQEVSNALTDYEKLREQHDRQQQLVDTLAGSGGGEGDLDLGQSVGYVGRVI